MCLYREYANEFKLTRVCYCVYMYACINMCHTTVVLVLHHKWWVSQCNLETEKHSGYSSLFQKNRRWKLSENWKLWYIRCVCMYVYVYRCMYVICISLHMYDMYVYPYTCIGSWQPLQTSICAASVNVSLHVAQLTRDPFLGSKDLFREVIFLRKKKSSPRWRTFFFWRQVPSLGKGTHRSRIWLWIWTCSKSIVRIRIQTREWISVWTFDPGSLFCLLGTRISDRDDAYIRSWHHIVTSVLPTYHRG